MQPAHQTPAGRHFETSVTVPSGSLVLQFRNVLPPRPAENNPAQVSASHSSPVQAPTQPPLSRRPMESHTHPHAWGIRARAAPLVSGTTLLFSLPLRSRRKDPPPRRQRVSPLPDFFL